MSCNVPPVNDKETSMITRIRWTEFMQSLVLVRLGQEMGSDTAAAQTVAGVLDFAINLIGKFFSA
jgi:hypothetical protein